MYFTFKYFKKKEKRNKYGKSLKIVKSWWGIYMCLLYYTMATFIKSSYFSSWNFLKIKKKLSMGCFWKKKRHNFNKKILNHSLGWPFWYTSIVNNWYFSPGADNENFPSFLLNLTPLPETHLHKLQMWSKLCISWILEKKKDYVCVYNFTLKYFMASYWP